MSIPPDVSVAHFEQLGPGLPHIPGVVGRLINQGTFSDGSVSFIIMMTAPAPELSASDFALVKAGDADATISVEPIDGDYPGREFRLTLHNFTGDGTLIVTPADPSSSNWLTFPTLAIDTTAPELLSTRFTTPSGNFGAGAQIVLEVTFSERIGVKGAPVLELSNGALATYSGGSGTGKLLFTYTVAPGDQASDLTVTGFRPNGAQTEDVAGNAVDWSNLHLHSPGTINVDGGTGAPVVTGFSVHSSSGSGEASAGDTITYTLQTSAPVVSLYNDDQLPPALELSNGEWAEYAGPDADGNMTFAYTIRPGDPLGALTVVGYDAGGARVQTPYDVGVTPETMLVGTQGFSALATGDLNGDGQVDIALASISSRQVSVQLGNGDGSFASSGQTLTLSYRPTAIVVADINGDDIDDVITSSKSEISVLLGNGDGTLQAPVTSNVTDDTGASLITINKMDVIDFDGDGKLEVYVNGTATKQFEGTTGESLSDFYNYTSLRVLHWDDGASRLSPDSRFSTMPLGGGSFVSFQDFDGDGRLDAAGASASANPAVGYSPPEIVYEDPVTGEAITTVGSQEPLTSFSVSYGLDIFSNTGGQILTRSPWSMGDRAYLATYDTQLMPTVATTGVLSAGGKPALISAGKNFLNVIKLGSNTQYETCTYQTPIELLHSVKTIDINGDGHLDVLLGGLGTLSDGTSTALMSLFLNFGDGRLTHGSTIDVGGLGAPPLLNTNENSFAIDDVNGDGRSDILLADRLTGASVMLNLSTPSSVLDISGFASAIAHQASLTVVQPSSPPPDTPEFPQVSPNEQGGRDIAITDLSQLSAVLGTSRVDTVFYSGSGKVTLPETIDNLVLTGTATGGTGNSLANVMQASNQSAMLKGLGGNDKLYGSNGNDTLDGGTGNDVLTGGGGRDSMSGGTGSDTYEVNSRYDRVVEGRSAGADTVKSAVNYTLSSNVENLILTGGAKSGSGNSLANVIRASDVSATLKGMAGDDKLYGGGGHDRLDGGSGNDRVSGGAGKDTLMGGSGDDVISGGLGADRLDGGVGHDTFVFNTALGKGEVDIILGFNPLEDAIVLENAVFKAVGGRGALDWDAFRWGNKALDANDRILYDVAKGTLSYDADGSGSGAAVQFAKVDPWSWLSLDDFRII